MLSPFFRLVLATMGSASVLAVRPPGLGKAAGKMKASESDKKDLRGQLQKQSKAAELLEVDGLQVDGTVKAFLRLWRAELKSLVSVGGEMDEDEDEDEDEDYLAPRKYLDSVFKCQSYLEALLSEDYQYQGRISNELTVATNGTWGAGTLKEYKKQLDLLVAQITYPG